MNGTHALGGFLGRKASAAGIPYEAAFKVLRLQNGADEGWRWLLTYRVITIANTVLKERLCS